LGTGPNLSRKCWHAYIREPGSLKLYPRFLWFVLDGAAASEGRGFLADEGRSVVTL
jgi:hypothetical protein